MSKIDVNNEIVLMRHSVRRARLHIVRKLIKQVKLLRVKKGDEKQRERYKRKGDKLGQELIALKKLAEDDISRYSITIDKSLETILADQKSDPETCVLARLAHNKIISDRVAQFKQKFPSYAEHLGPGRKKLIKLKRKAGKQAKKEAKATAGDKASTQDAEEMENNDTKDVTSYDNDSVQSTEEIEENSLEIKENNEPEFEEKITTGKREAESSCSVDKRMKCKTKSFLKVKPREIKSGKSEAEVSKTDIKLNKLSGISSTSREATVKRFANFLEENKVEDLESPEITKESEIVLEKEVDSFFMTGDGGGEYLSVVVPKSNVTDDDEDVATGNTREPISARSRNNNRFFDKVEGFERPRNNNSNNKFARGERFQDRNQSRDLNKAVNISGERKSKQHFGNADKSGNEKIHPSWAAKKKEQEILKLGFQGKKIVFDDV